MLKEARPFIRLRNEASPLSMRQKEAQSYDQVVPGGPSALLGQQTQGIIPRTRGPFSARIDPGLTKDCPIN